MHTLQKKLLKISGQKNIGDLSLREVGKLVGEEDAPQKVKHHLLQLQKHGLIQINWAENIIEKTRRGPVAGSPLISVAILGSANCGPATIYADQNVEGYLRISGKLLTKKKDIFAIKAVGYSMNKANINGEAIDDGDYVIVDPTYRNFKNGDYVLSILDNTANIKRYFNDKEHKRIILLSESSASVSPIFVHYDDLDRYLVNGRVIQVIKKPKTAWSTFKRFVYRQA